jgi:endonuclease/exonuclease/phosphatase family metal-dependent hydrolase
MRFTIATYNIHKGFSHLTRRMVIHELRERLHHMAADVLFLQEVQGSHDRHAERYNDWPGKGQHEFIADQVWHEVAYGKNAIYRTAIHGNALLSRFPIVLQENEDISAHAYESRGLLHCTVSLGPRMPELHCLNVHLGLTERGRTWQVRALCERIRKTVPRTAPLVIAGDFNDWRHRANRPARRPARGDRGVRGGQGPLGAHVPVGDAAVPPRPHLLARPRRDRRARPLRVPGPPAVRPRGARRDLRARGPAAVLGPVGATGTLA